jgi:hypothetical protein
MTFSTIYISLTFYAIALALLISARNERTLKLARLAWTMAFVFYVAHIISAYHFQHHWSQADALQHAAKRTYDVVGLDWDGGIYVNYVFTLVWLCDVAWWWADATGYRNRPKWLTGSIHAFFVFIAFNSSVVFAEGAVRWIGLVVTLALAGLWAIRTKTPIPSRDTGL